MREPSGMLKIFYIDLGSDNMAVYTRKNPVSAHLKLICFAICELYHDLKFK